MWTATRLAKPILQWLTPFRQVCSARTWPYLLCLLGMFFCCWSRPSARRATLLYQLPTHWTNVYRFLRG